MEPPTYAVSHRILMDISHPELGEASVGMQTLTFLFETRDILITNNLISIRQYSRHHNHNGINYFLSAHDLAQEASDDIISEFSIDELNDLNWVATFNSDSRTGRKCSSFARLVSADDKFFIKWIVNEEEIRINYLTWIVLRL